MATAATTRLYCADPDCPYCKELREIQELVRTGKLPNVGQPLPVGFHPKQDATPVRTGQADGKSRKS